MAQTAILIKIQTGLVVTLRLPQPPQPGDRATDHSQKAVTEHPQRAERCAKLFLLPHYPLQLPGAATIIIAILQMTKLRRTQAE